MGRNEPIPAGIDDNNEVIPLELLDDSNVDFAATKIFIAAINEGHQLVCTNQVSPNSPDYTKLTQVDDNSYYFNLLDSATTLGGYVSIVAVDDSKNTIQYIVENPEGNETKNRWLPREDLGLPKGVTKPHVIRLIRDLNGMDIVFVSSFDKENFLAMKHRNPPTTVEKKVEITPPGSDKPITITVQEQVPPKTPWSDWIDFSGSLKQSFQTMHVGSNADGTVVITGNFGDSTALVRQQSAKDPYDPSKWADWTAPGGDGAGYFLAKPMLDKNNKVSVFSLFAEVGEFARSSQTKIGSDDWEPWSTPGRTEGETINYGLSIDGDGCVYAVKLVQADADGNCKILGNREIMSVNATWSGWDWIGTVKKANSIELSYSADGSLAAFIIDEAGVLSMIYQVTIDSSEWSLFPKVIAKGINTFSLTRDMTP